VPDEIKIAEQNPDCIRLLQITDTHIFESEQALFDGVDTNASLNAVIEQIKRDNSEADMMLVSGDLVHDPVDAAYIKLRKQLMKLDLPVFCLPGNHDNPVLMHKLLNMDNVQTSKLVRAGNWQIILLDTFLQDSHSGRLQQEELDFLQQQLEQTAAQFVLICLHHPPVSVDSSWMDAMMLENPEQLFSVLDKFKQVRGIIWGHIHQEFRKKRKNVVLYGSPSTCIQFKPKSTEYIRDKRGPAYSLLQLHSNGKIQIKTIKPGTDHDY
jgi:Icc protein